MQWARVIAPAPLLLLLTAEGLSQAAAKELRASRNTYTPVIDVLAPGRTAVTDEQLKRLEKLPIEAVWGALQAKQYRQCFVTGFQMTQPNKKLVGRALTMRYLPVRGGYRLQ